MSSNRRGTRVFAALTTLALLSGCTVYSMPPASTDHPAHPQAAAAPSRPLSPTLTARADEPSRDDLFMGTESTHAMEHAAAPLEEQRTVVGEGIVVALVPDTQQIVIDHEEIGGFMNAMTMGFRVYSPSLLDHVRSGDSVRFTIDTATDAIIAIERVTAP